MRRNYKNLAPAIEYKGEPSYVRTIQLSPFGQAITEAGADLVHTVFAQIVLLIAGLLLMLAKDQHWEPNIALWIFRISCLPWPVLAGRIIVRTTAPLVEIIAGRDPSGPGRGRDITPASRARVAPVFIPGTLIHRADFEFFVNEIVTVKKWSQAAWRGRALPGVGRCSNTYWKGMIELLKGYGALIGHGDRRTGQLLISDSAAFLESVDLGRPPALRPDFPSELIEH